MIYYYPWYLFTEYLPKDSRWSWYDPEEEEVG